MQLDYLHDIKLSLKAKGLLSIMLSIPDDSHYTVKQLTDITSDGETSIRTALKELITSGYIEIQCKRNNGKIVECKYKIKIKR